MSNYLPNLVKPDGIPSIDWAHPAAQGLIAFAWPTATYVDLVSGKGFTKNGSPTPALLNSGRAETAGTTNYFSLTDARFDLQSSFAVDCEASFSSVTADLGYALVYVNNATPDDKLFLWYAHNIAFTDSLDCGLYSSGYQDNPAALTITLNRTYRFGFVFDAVAAKSYLFVDGRLISTATVTGTPRSISNATLRIGDGGNVNIAGNKTVGYARLWNYAPPLGPFAEWMMNPLDVLLDYKRYWKTPASGGVNVPVMYHNRQMQGSS